MGTLRSSLKSFTLGILLAFYTAFPALADDTEIYFGGNTNISVRPNVLFVLDTSGSMGWYDGTSQTRMDRMKAAMNSMLTNVQDINAGLMQFNNPGGPVIYPVTYIDEPIGAVVGDDVLTGVAQASIESGANDAEQLGDNSVVLNNTQLSLITHPSVTVTETVTVQVAHAEDDAEEEVSNNRLRLNNKNMHYVRRGNNDGVVGLRFNNVDVPRGAIVTDARLEFEVGKVLRGPVYIDIYGEDSSDPQRFSNSHKILSRTLTSQKVNWTLTEEPPVDGKVTSPDITSVVQAIIDRADWDAMDRMVFVLKDDPGTSNNNIRRFESFDGEPSAAPKLHITYNYTSPAATNDYVGLRFEGLTIPQGADITSAKLSLVASNDVAATTNLIIQAENADDSTAFEATDNNLGARQKTLSTVNWSPPGWTAETTYESPDLSAVIESVTNRSGWCGGNALTLLVKGSGQRFAYAFEGSSTESVKLDVRYDVNSVSEDACNVKEYSVPITHGNDDVEEYGSSGSMYYDSSDLELVADTDDNRGNQVVGLRFNNVQLKQDADINHAYIEFYTDETDPTGTAELTIKAENVDNAPAFSNSHKPSQIYAGNNSVSWTITSTWDTENEVHRTPDISGLLEQVVSRSGWAPGNSIVLTISGTGERSAHAYEGSVLFAPKLVFLAQKDDVPVGTGGIVRSKLIELVNDLPTAGNTPVVDTLYEAALYYRGGTVDYGKSRGSHDYYDYRKTNRVSHPLSYTGGTLVQPTGCSSDNLNDNDCKEENITGSPVYISPVTESCQQSYIVLLTDGSANENHSVSKIENMLGYTGSEACSSTGNSAEKCGEELLDFLKDSDQIAGLGGDQKITTYTIGFNFSSDWIRDLAVSGGGNFHTADSSAELLDVFETILKSIKATDASFVEPSVTVNQFNRFSHRDDIYYSLFKPQQTAKWVGNLKKYRQAGSQTVIVDADGDPAIDQATGFFKNDARSYWSSDPDGSKVELGGAASRLPAPADRKIYTYMGSLPVVNDGTDLLSAYPVNSANTDIDRTVLGIPSESTTHRNKLLNWTIGLKPDGTTARNELGDPLHSRPVIFTYDSDAVAKTFESTIFFGTNEGYIHAIDADTGIEEFAFIPKELLPNLNTFYTNQTVSPRPYGMDGEITILSHDDNKDGDYLDDYDYVYLYSGMRRGGRNYYALDVSDIKVPEFLWQIKGGPGGTTGFSELGQTWSAPKKIKVKFDGVSYDLLMFAGGYDPIQDSVNVRTVDTMGRAIYMVNAKDGSLFWTAGIDAGSNLPLADMKYSIPSDIRTLDLDGDGYVDQFYVGDMGGQIWRFDVNQKNVDDKTDLVKGGVIADFAGNTQASNRRFYYPPDVSINADGAHRFMGVSVGSGYRAHPLNEAIQDRFYVLKQFDDIYTPPTTYLRRKEADLYDATLNLIVEGTSDEQNKARAALSSTNANKKDGWYIRLTNSGEKVLAESITLNGLLVFTTYQPYAAVTSSCKPAVGTARAYIVNIIDGTPSSDINGDGSTTKEDRVIQLKNGGIPPKPTVTDTVDGKPVVRIGTEPLSDVDTGRQIIRTYWYEKESD